MLNFFFGLSVAYSVVVTFLFLSATAAYSKAADRNRELERRLYSASNAEV